VSNHSQQGSARPTRGSSRTGLLPAAWASPRDVTPLRPSDFPTPPLRNVTPPARGRRGSEGRRSPVEMSPPSRVQSTRAELKLAPVDPPWQTASHEQRERPHEPLGSSQSRARAARGCSPPASPDFKPHHPDPDQGEQVNHTEPTAKTRSRRAGLFATLRGLLPANRSGAPSRSPKLLALTGASSTHTASPCPPRQVGEQGEGRVPTHLRVTTTSPLTTNHSKPIECVPFRGQRGSMDRTQSAYNRKD
jgi:hypothetical protein